MIMGIQQKEAKFNVSFVVLMVTWFKWHINFRELVNAKVILVEEQRGYFLTYGKGFNTLPRRMKVNVTVQLEFKFV